MSGNRGKPFYELEVYKRYEAISDQIWSLVNGWPLEKKQHPGQQLLRSIDSVGANIAESVGRIHFKDGLRYLYFARGSLTETVHWLRLAGRRELAGSE